MKTNLRITLVAVIALAAMPVSAFAQQTAPAAPAPMPPMTMPSMPGMKMTPPAAGIAMPGMTTGGDASPSSRAFKAADDKMMQTMMGAAKTGDADQDFVTSMLPHHQGAVDMAKVELRYGKDPAMRRLATGIIKAQEKEIAEMTAWQKAHPVAR